MNTRSFVTRGQPGLAIGPILFVVAILAVLVGALAAGSGGFSGSTKNDSMRIQASALIEQGATLKLGFDRLYGNGMQLNEIIISPSLSTGAPSNALFHNAGGQATLPVAPSVIVPDSGTTSWRFVGAAHLPFQGDVGNDFAAVVGIRNADYCKAINTIVFGRDSPQATTNIPAPSAPLTVTLNDLGSCSDVTVTTTTGGCNVAANSFDLSGHSGIDGRSQACVSDGAGTPKYYYYQVLLVR